MSFGRRRIACLPYLEMDKLLDGAVPGNGEDALLAGLTQRTGMKTTRVVPAAARAWMQHPPGFDRDAIVGSV